MYIDNSNNLIAIIIVQLTDIELDIMYNAIMNDCNNIIKNNTRQQYIDDTYFIKECLSNNIDFCNIIMILDFLFTKYDNNFINEFTKTIIYWNIINKKYNKLL